MIDKKALFVYLVLSFLIAYALEGALIATGFRAEATPPFFTQFALAAVMWVPGFAALVTVLLVQRKDIRSLGLHFGHWPAYLRSWAVVALAFGAIYGLTALLGLGSPDWSMNRFLTWTGAGLLEPGETIRPGALAGGLYFAALFIAPFFNSLFSLGEELGWRGYLLPALLPLGRLRAYLLVGIVWGLWYLPLILTGFFTPGFPYVGILFVIGFTTALSIYINTVFLESRSTLLVAWIHGNVNSQVFGFWSLLFWGTQPLLGGYTGLVGIAVWLVIGFWKLRSGLKESGSDNLELVTEQKR